LNLPEKFAKRFKAHIWALIPLIATLLLQKLHDVIDDRFISSLGAEALAIHNIQYSLFLIGQEIGLASATSALIFWKRKESLNKQGSILKLHLLMPLVLGIIAAGAVLFFISDICRYFHVPFQYMNNAVVYLGFGLLNLICRGLYIPLNAILIACDYRLRSALLAGGILVGKLLIGWVAVNHSWDFASDPGSLELPMNLIGAGSVVILLLAIGLAYQWVSESVDGWEKLDWKSVFKVWPGELGIASVSALSPMIFGFQIAHVIASGRFFVTYQLALHLTCILTLPILAGSQIAVRDASAEQSDSPERQYKPLHESRWWPQFFYASLVPTCILLIIASIFSRPLFNMIYNYQIPEDHLVFLPLFFLSWITWQVGTIFLIMIRAAKKNGLATRNFLIAGLGVQVGFTQLLIVFQVITPINLGLVTLAYCCTYLFMNWQTIDQIQSKYYLFKYREIHLRFPRRLHLPIPRVSNAYNSIARR
jgi:hypothetical protein